MFSLYFWRAGWPGKSPKLGCVWLPRSCGGPDGRGGPPVFPRDECTVPRGFREYISMEFFRRVEERRAAIGSHGRDWLATLVGAPGGDCCHYRFQRKRKDNRAQHSGPAPPTRQASVRSIQIQSSCVFSQI